MAYVPQRENFTGYVGKNLALYKFRNGMKLSTRAAGNFIRSELATALRKVRARVPCSSNNAHADLWTLPRVLWRAAPPARALSAMKGGADITRWHARRGGAAARTHGERVPTWSAAAVATPARARF